MYLYYLIIYEASYGAVKIYVQHCFENSVDAEVLRKHFGKEILTAP